jgi:hypothetical protein
MSTQYTAQIQALYVAYFNRPADSAGLAFWETQMANGGSLKAISADFAQQAEYKSEYAGMKPDQVLNKVYMNLFGRTIDAGGLEFWGPKLATGAVSIDFIVLEVAKGAQGTDLETYENRTAASVAYTDGLNSDVNFRLAYSNTAAVNSAKAFLNGITTDASLTAAIAPAALTANLQQMAIDSAPVASSITLTALVDTVTGTSGNDVFNASNDANGNATFTDLDTINGGAGNDTLNIISTNSFNMGSVAGASLVSIENVVLRGAQNVVADTTGYASVTSLKSIQSGYVSLTAGAATAIQVLNATGDIEVIGGSSQSVTATAANTNIDMSEAGGAISATHNAQGYGSIEIDGGTSVNLVAAGRSTGGIDIGAIDAPTGAVTVSATGEATEADAFTTLGAISVKGGSTVVVNQIATSNADAAIDDTDGSIVNQSAVTVTGTSKTTSVTVNQSAEVGVDAALTTVASAKEVQTVTFSAMTAGQTVSVNGLAFTAVKDLTALQAASAYANLAASVAQGSAPAGNGIYSGTATANFTTGAAVAGGTTLAPTATVTFTASASKGDVPLLTSLGSKAVVIAAVTDGATGVAGYDGTLGVNAGAVTIHGDITGTDVLSTVSLNSYGNSTIESSALTKLNLANSSHSVTVTNTAATALSLALNNVGTNTGAVLSGAAINLGSTYTTLNITADTSTSRASITASSVENLQVSGTKTAILSGSSLAALKTVTVSGAAGLTMDASGSNVTSVDTSATTGTTSFTIDAANATFVGGAGADTVALLNTTTTKAVTLGAGNDTLILKSGTTSLTANMDGGTGTDILRMDALDAAGASSNGTFATKIDGFEKLQLNAVVSGGANTVDLANLDNINYVISAGTALNVSAANEVQTVAVTGTASGAVAFLGTSVAGSVATDSAAVTAGRITADSANIIAAWNLANPTKEIASISNSGAVVSVTYLSTEGDVANLAAASSSGISFAGAVEATKGAIASTAGALTLTHVADAATLELTGAGANAIVTMNDATGTADSLNIVTKVSSSSINFGSVAAAGVETINLTVTDTVPTSSGVASIQTATLNLTDAALKSLIITGNSHLNLGQTAAALTMVDGSAMTGNLTAYTNGTVSQMIKGGAGADILIANGNADVLIGGAGNDTLRVGLFGDLTTMTGGAGNDTFDVSLATTNVNSYATITDLTAGDKILFAASGTSFIASKVSLSDTAVFQDLANAAIASTQNGQISWFQFGGNTYVIENVSDLASNSTADSTAFVNGTDVIVKIVGLVDLSTGSFSSSSHTLLAV